MKTHFVPAFWSTSIKFQMISSRDIWIAVSIVLEIIIEVGRAHIVNKPGNKKSYISL